MTAHALQEDRERCLAAGMDAYLSKPVNAREMIPLIESFARGAAPVAELPAAAHSPAESCRRKRPPYSMRSWRWAVCFDNPEVVEKMVQHFLDDTRGLLEQMHAALRGGDLVEFGRLGHRLKGTVGYLGAEPAREAAVRVERFSILPDGNPAEAVQSSGRLGA